MLSPEQPSAPPSKITTCVPAGDSNTIVRSPVQVCVMSKVTLRSVISKSSVTVKVLNTGPALLIIGALGLTEAAIGPVCCSPTHTITGAVLSSTVTVAVLLHRLRLRLLCLVPH
jgi:hypothetical protein